MSLSLLVGCLDSWLMSWLVGLMGGWLTFVLTIFFTPRGVAMRGGLNGGGAPRVDSTYFPK